MIERHIILEDIDPVVFYGVGNGHLQIIKSLYPKLRIVARDNVIRVLGDEEEMAAFEENVEKMRRHVLKFNNINDEDILDIIKGKQTKADSVKGVIVYNISGKPIKCKSENQQQLVDAYEKNDMIFATGPAGTGKTYLSIALAVRALKEKTIRKIILSRPAVEAGEKLGFLPGDMKDRPVPATALRRARRHAARREAAGHDGEERNTDCSARLHARTHTQRRCGDTRRGAEHYTGTDTNVPHTNGMEHEDDYHRRHDADRPAARTEERTHRGARHTEGRGGHRLRKTRTERHRKT